MSRFQYWVSSLRFRLLAATLVALALALVLASVLLGNLFRDHVKSQFETALTQQLNLLTARLEFDTAGQPTIDATTLHDPRWQKPFSGLYWQVDEVSKAGAARRGVLRSRSLWDMSLTLEADALHDGSVHVHEGSGPNGAALLMLERTVSTAEHSGTDWRLIVAADLDGTMEAVSRFKTALALSLAMLGGLLMLAAIAQVFVGLSPLRTLQTALMNVRENRAQRLLGRFPSEVQPLVDDFNGVLQNSADNVARARTHAGNLAHALKTPMAIMAQAAQASSSELATLVQEQVASANQQIDWHLARARAAAAHRMPGMRTPITPVVQGLQRVLERVHAHRHLDFNWNDVPREWAFAGEEQDLQEMIGNLLDNAYKWARMRVRLSAQVESERLVLTVEDDGEGIAATMREAALIRGHRLDEHAPGSGLGLAIVAELALLYGGQLTLDASSLGGLKASLSLPLAA
jgi:signal transduction histidine kinase